MEKVEGAAAGFYVAALFESARPGHRGLNTARLVADARARSRAGLGRLRASMHCVRVSARPRAAYAPHVEGGTRARRPRSRARVRGKPRRKAAA